MPGVCRGASSAAYAEHRAPTPVWRQCQQCGGNVSGVTASQGREGRERTRVLPAKKLGPRVAPSGGAGPLTQQTDCCVHSSHSCNQNHNPNIWLHIFLCVCQPPPWPKQPHSCHKPTYMAAHLSCGCQPPPWPKHSCHNPTYMAAHQFCVCQPPPWPKQPHSCHNPTYMAAHLSCVCQPTSAQATTHLSCRLAAPSPLSTSLQNCPNRARCDTNAQMD
jgi:hypothetical protein